MLLHGMQRPQIFLDGRFEDNVIRRHRAATAIALLLKKSAPHRGAQRNGPPTCHAIEQDGSFIIGQGK
jgi:hypothetical protein